MRMRPSTCAMLLILIGSAGCSKTSTTGPKPAPSPTRFTVFASDRGRSAGSFRNYITGLDVSGTSGFVFGTGTGVVDKHPSITGDGNLLVYQSSPGRGGSQDIFGYSRSSDHLTDDTNINTDANETDPYISLDGRRLAFVRDTLGRTDIRLYDTQSRSFIPLAALKGGAGSSDWAPSLDEQGDRLVFVSDRSGNPDVYLYQVSTQDLSAIPATASDGADIEPSISGNGRWVCFASNRAGGVGDYDLYLFDRSAGQLVALPANSSSSDRDPSISFDGTYIHFASDRPGGLGGMDLWLLNRATGTVQEVSGQNSAAADVDPVIVWK